MIQGKAVRACASGASRPASGVILAGDDRQFVVVERRLHHLGGRVGASQRSDQQVDFAGQQMGEQFG
jgi:Holliday junction resolvase